MPTQQKGPRLKIEHKTFSPTLPPNCTYCAFKGWSRSTIAWSLLTVQWYYLADNNSKFRGAFEFPWCFYSSFRHLHDKRSNHDTMDETTKQRRQIVLKGVQIAVAFARWHVCLSLWLWTMISHFAPRRPTESDPSIFGNNGVALTHSARVLRTMVAQGHYLHIVKGCAERALENEKL